MTVRPALVRWGAWGGAAVMLLGAAALRLSGEGRAELAASDAALEKGDARAATVHARGAAEAYVPWGAHVSLAYRRLRVIAESSEGRGDVDASLFAWRAIRAACFGSRPFATDCARQREAADLAIARLSAVRHASPGMHLQKPRRPTLSDDAAHLSAEVPPRIGWGALLVVGAILWGWGGARFASREESSGPIKIAEHRIAFALAAVGLVVWLAGLFMA